jgi:quercetin dioxygenase-like cupin family protein
MTDPVPDPTSDPAHPPTAGVRPVDLRDYVRFAPDAATCVRVFATGHLSLELWCIQPQQATEVLRYPAHDVTYTVLGGRSWFVTDQGEIGLDPLGAMLVPADTVHGIDNRAPDPLIVVAVAAPPTPGTEDAPVTTDATAVRLDDDAPGPLRRVLDGLFGAERR